MEVNPKAKPPDRSPVVEIAAGVYQIQLPLAGDPMVATLGHVNSYLLRGRDSWLMIDTGWSTPESINSLERSLSSLGLGLSDISTIVTTHCHPDHFGLAGRIKHLSPRTELLMHRWEADLIESRYIKFSEPQERMSSLLEHHGVPRCDLEPMGAVLMPSLQFVTITLPDHVLYGGEIIHTGEFSLEVIWTPGHSPGHICLYEPENQLLFSGDHILPSITPNISYHILSGDNPLGDYIYALGKLKHLSVSRILPGHQDSFTDLKGKIESIIEHHSRREVEIMGVLGTHTFSSYEIASLLKWHVPFAWDQFPLLQKRYAITETIAHTEHMRLEGKVEKFIRDDYVTYRAL